ncbi:SDR family NAD(P)-dependent oxidoreductase [Xanthovirga aplysinae]|uniref:SDR family NAD(P)-dependent oxidoreductase n=1 Tax=Xanthovirga aplysinae TaxID=2529853 RepID=UPI0012BB6541|nr:SDR family NAD(P)-dependent oxidoreductase [Xanthovirga aplysinae]MTI30621.1 SDR family NAD(P)-dependent oxidoreductase [Xanthovirga aplysinae]
MNKKILITGANVGIGKDTARQLAMKNETEKIYLACRNETKAIAAKKDLEKKTGRSIFEIIVMDVSDIDSVKTAVLNLPEPIDALIMNAGGLGGKTRDRLTKEGATQIFASNVLGHVVLTDELIKAGKLKNIALFAGSESARGIKKMGLKPPELKTSSTNEFKSIIDGTFFGYKTEALVIYAYVKYIAALWMSAMARKHNHMRFITMSPGSTSGTAVLDDISGFKKFRIKYIMMPFIMPLMGMVHGLEKGAKRFVDGINNKKLKSGVFYGSKLNVLTGPIVDQSEFFTNLRNTTIQDNAYEAVYKFLK